MYLSLCLFICLSVVKKDEHWDNRSIQAENGKMTKDINHGIPVVLTETIY